ncbi:hypothetical protein K488DRAFT_84999 [Vararia minispora EC-137]|uniref:Uncharacterized protein n=1 Tax=Vararia minispora EC-137 TaxID=1314806 RepID=A0ACB8QNS1_9AGAM|nr:hypothetical protein K488DRAFT_84999 [Vararia minispora EC-137]
MTTYSNHLGSARHARSVPSVNEGLVDVFIAGALPLDLIGGSDDYNSCTMARSRPCTALGLLGTTAVTRLGPSLNGAGGLNVRSVQDVLAAHLTSLVLDGAPLVNRDILLLHHLPSLSAFHLANTTVSDESPFHLITPRHSLACLSLHNNTSITDDACPAPALLTCPISPVPPSECPACTASRAPSNFPAHTLPPRTHSRTHSRTHHVPVRRLRAFHRPPTQPRRAVHVAHNRALFATMPARPGADAATRKRLQVWLEMLGVCDGTVHVGVIQRNKLPHTLTVSRSGE